MKFEWNKNAVTEIWFYLTEISNIKLIKTPKKSLIILFFPKQHFFAFDLLEFVVFNEVYDRQFDSLDVIEPIGQFLDQLIIINFASDGHSSSNRIFDF